MEQKLNEFLTKNNIQVDENGNFEACIVVDADDAKFCSSMRLPCFEKSIGI